MVSVLPGPTVDRDPHEHGVARNDKSGAVAHLLRRVWTAEGAETAVIFALCLTFGSATYFSIREEPDGALVFVAVLASWLVWRGARLVWRVPLLAIIGLIVFGVSAGFGLAKLRTAFAGAPVVTESMAPTIVEGWVTMIDRGNSGPRLTLDVHAIAGLSPEHTPRLVRVTHITTLEVGPGRFVRCYAVLRPPPAPSLAGDYDFQRAAWFRGLGAVGYVQGRCRGGALGPPQGILRKAAIELASLRRQFAAYVNDAAGPRAGGFAAALMSGDRSFMAVEDAEALRGSGLAHLLAISGLHMGIVGGMVYLLMRRGLALIEPLAVRVAVQKPAAAAALLASACYLAMSGASISTQRAFIMAAIFFGAILFDRSALSLRSFALAMIAVVAIYPESVMTPGFQMSFAATGALIATYEAWSRRRRARQTGRGSGFVFSIQSLVVTSIVGAAATAPFAIFHFGRVATLGLLANLAAMPIITFISAPLAAASLIAAPFGLSRPVIGLFGQSLEWVLSIAHALDNDIAAGSAGLNQMPGLALGFSVLALSSIVVLRGAPRLFMIGLASSLAMLVWWRGAALIVHVAPSGDVYVMDSEGSHLRASFATGDGLGPLRFAGLDVSSDCSESTCRFETPAGPVTLHPGDPRTQTCGDLGEGIHVFADGDETWCPNTLTWREAERLGGQAFLMRPGGEIARARPEACRPRPWAPCG